MRTCIHCIQIWPLVTREESGIFVRLCRGEAVGHTYGPLFRHAQQDPSPLVSPRRTSFFFLSLGLSPCRSIAFLQQAPFIYCCCPRYLKSMLRTRTEPVLANIHTIRPVFPSLPCLSDEKNAEQGGAAPSPTTERCRNYIQDPRRPDHPVGPPRLLTLLTHATTE